VLAESYLLYMATKQEIKKKTEGQAKSGGGHGPPRPPLRIAIGVASSKFRAGPNILTLNELQFCLGHHLPKHKTRYPRYFWGPLCLAWLRLWLQASSEPRRHHPPSISLIDEQ